MVLFTFCSSQRPSQMHMPQAAEGKMSCCKSQRHSTGEETMPEVICKVYPYSSNHLYYKCRVSIGREENYNSSPWRGKHGSGPALRESVSMKAINSSRAEKIFVPIRPTITNMDWIGCTYYHPTVGIVVDASLLACTHIFLLSRLYISPPSTWEWKILTTTASTLILR